MFLKAPTFHFSKRISEGSNIQSQNRIASVHLDDDVWLQAQGDDSIFGSPVFKLIHSIFEFHSERAFEILRRPLFLNFEPLGPSLAMIQVLAKRWKQSPVPDGLQIRMIPSAIPTPTFNPSQQQWLKDWMGMKIPAEPERRGDLLSRAELIVDRGEQQFHSSRRIATFICDSQRTVLAMGWNLRSQNKVWHSEMVAAFQLLSQKNRVPLDRLIVLTSLQPCRMCAKSLLSVAQVMKSQIEVHFAEFDEGPKAKDTGLEGRQFHLSSKSSSESKS